MTAINKNTFNELKELSGAEFINELIDAFLDDAPRMLKEMSSALASSDVELFRRTAHSLKSNSNTFGAEQLFDLSKDLEFIARENRLKDVGSKLNALAAEYKKVEAELKALRNG